MHLYLLLHDKESTKAGEYLILWPFLLHLPLFTYPILLSDSTKPIILKIALHRALRNSQIMLEAFQFHLLSFWKACLVIRFLSLHLEREKKNPNGVELPAPSQHHLNLLKVLFRSCNLKNMLSISKPQGAYLALHKVSTEDTQEPLPSIDEWHCTKTTLKKIASLILSQSDLRVPFCIWKNMYLLQSTL